MSAYSLGINVRPYTDTEGHLHGGYTLVVSETQANQCGVRDQWASLYRRARDLPHNPRNPDWQDGQDLVNACGAFVGQGATVPCDWFVTLTLVPDDGKMRDV